MGVTDAAPASRDRLPSLTGLRAWAALLVVTYHLSHELVRLPVASYAVQYGRSGVTLFFVLSGFVLTYTYLQTPTSRRAFYWRRFARIWPLHITALAIGAGVLWAVGDPRHVVDLLPAAALLQSWMPVEAFDQDTVGTSWSLSNEAFFYAVFPFILAPLAARSRRWLRWTLVLLAGYLAWHVLADAVFEGYTLKWSVDRLPLARVTQFLTGVFVGAEFAKGRRAPLSLLTTVALVVVWHMLLIPYEQFAPSGFPRASSAAQSFSFPLFTLLIWAAAQADRDRRSSPLLASRLAIRLGHWSYALYLTHPLVIILWLKAVDKPSGTVQGLVAWLTILVVAQLFAGVLYRLVERPAESWLRSREPGRRKVTAVSP